MGKCSIAYCDGEAYCNGLCSRHYNRLRTTGTTDPGPRARAPLEERIWRFIDKRSANECWPWIGKSLNQGYGTIGKGPGFRGNHVLAHRAIWEMTFGPIPSRADHHGTVVRHLCNNRLCCNPSHLCLGTQGDNVSDMWESDGPKGNARLSLLQIAEIRSDKRSSRKLAPLYGVSDAHIRAIRRDRCWKG